MVGVTAMFLAAKDCCCEQSSVHQLIVIVNESALVPPSFRTFSADLLPQTMLNLPVVLLVNCLAQKNKFLLNCNPQSKHRQHTFDVLPDLPRFLRTWSGRAFPQIGLLFCFRMVTVNPRFLSCYDPREESFDVSGFIQQLLAYKHAPLLLLVGEKPKHKPREDPSPVEILH
jgi:hypothetical protein